MKTIFLCEDPAAVRRVYDLPLRQRFSGSAAEDPPVFRADDLRADPAAFADTETVFSTWGMPALSEQEIQQLLPALRCVFYAAGSVQGFARPFLRQGIRVFCAASANAEPVAEYTLAAILMAGKNFLPLLSRHSRALPVGEFYNGIRGNFGTKIGILGAGRIGKRVLRLLRGFSVSTMVYDPFLSSEDAALLGAEKTDALDRVFSECQVVSNHLANNAQTQGILNYRLFSRMLPYATFINTGRGAQVVEEDLCRSLKERPDLTALLDVTAPEPPQPGHPFYTLENCFLTPHIAGSLGAETHRMAAYMEEEYDRLLAGAPAQYEVTLPMLETMA